MLVLLLTALTTHAVDVVPEEAVPEWDDDLWLSEMATKMYPDPQYVDVVFIGDRSASMDQYQGSSQLGIRGFAEKHRDNAIRSAADQSTNGVTTHMEIVTFDDQKERPFSGDATTITQEDIDNCARAMQPRRSTMLYDTGVEELEAQALRMKQKEEEGYAVHAVYSLLTDGDDTASRRFSKRQLREAIQEAEARGVQCMFVQAGTDAIRIGGEYGFAGARTLEMGHDPRHAEASMRAVTDQTTDFTAEASLSAVPSTSSRHYTGAVSSAPARGAYDDDYDVHPVAPLMPSIGLIRSLTTPSAPAFTPLERVASCQARDYSPPPMPMPAVGRGYTAPVDALRVRSDTTGYTMPPAPLSRTPAMPSLQESQGSQASMPEL